MAGPWTTDDVDRRARQYVVADVLVAAAAVGLVVAGWLLGRIQLLMPGILLVVLLPLLVLKQRQILRLMDAQMTEDLEA